MPDNWSTSSMNAETPVLPWSTSQLIRDALYGPNQI
jgi:hypothetical protein